MEEVKFDRMIDGYDSDMFRDAPNNDELEIIAERDPELARELAQIVDIEEEA
jgi:hypothetical protein